MNWDSYEIKFVRKKGDKKGNFKRLSEYQIFQDGRY